MSGVEATEELWREALADSGLDSSAVHRFDAVRAAREGFGAQWWAPHESVFEPPIQLELSDEDAEAADSSPLFERHRVATAPIEGLEPRLAEAALAAKLRHELEHARQWNACGPDPFRLMQLALEVHRRKTGGTIYGTLRNQVPIEDDANAAASVFVRRIRPDAAEELRMHETYGSLVRASIGPASTDTLVVRMVGFLFHYREIIRDLADGTPEAMYVRLWAAGGAKAWKALCDAADAARSAE